MKKRLLLWILPLLLGGLIWGATSKKKEPDAIETMINNERTKVDAWLSEGDELPPAFLLGDKSGVRLYADYMEVGSYDKLCGGLDLEALLAATQGNSLLEKFPVNVGIEKVRNMLDDFCMVRPGDVLLGVGRGWQTMVTVKDLTLVKENAVCLSDSPYSLWASFEEALQEEPLFFVSGGDNPQEGENLFQDTETAFQKASEEESSDLLKRLQLPLSYKVEFFKCPFSNCDVIYLIRKTNVGLDDVGTPNEALVWMKGDRWEILETELVKEGESSGHIWLEGVLDFNNDQRLDLWVVGDQKGCPYVILYVGDEVGFHAVPMPSKPCSC